MEHAKTTRARVRPGDGRRTATRNPPTSGGHREGPEVAGAGPGEHPEPGGVLGEDRQPDARRARGRGPPPGIRGPGRGCSRRAGSPNVCRVMGDARAPDGDASDVGGDGGERGKGGDQREVRRAEPSSAGRGPRQWRAGVRAWSEVVMGVLRRRDLNGGQLNGVQVRVPGLRRQRGLTTGREGARAPPPGRHRGAGPGRPRRLRARRADHAPPRRELGLQPSAIYHHFPTKQALLAAVADEVLARGRRPRATRARWDDLLRRGLRRTAGRDAGLPRRRRPRPHRLCLRPRGAGPRGRAEGDPRPAPASTEPLAEAGSTDAAALRLRPHLRGADRAPGGERGRHRRVHGHRPGAGTSTSASVWSWTAWPRTRRRATASGAEVHLGAVQLGEQHRAGEVQSRPAQPGGREVDPVRGRPTQVGPARAWSPAGWPGPASRPGSEAPVRSLSDRSASRRSSPVRSSRAQVGAADRHPLPLPAAHGHRSHRRTRRRRSRPACSRRASRRRTSSGVRRSRRTPSRCASRSRTGSCGRCTARRRAPAVVHSPKSTPVKVQSVKRAAPRPVAVPVLVAELPSARHHGLRHRRLPGRGDSSPAPR